MRKVSQGNSPLLINIGDERTLVVDTEGEDSVLVGGTESGGVNLGLSGGGGRSEGETVVGVEHGEFEL